MRHPHKISNNTSRTLQVFVSSIWQVVDSFGLNSKARQNGVSVQPALTTDNENKRKFVYALFIHDLSEAVLDSTQ